MIDSAQILSLRMVDRYLAGQLSPEETAEFEAYMLEHPEILDEINVTRRLKLGLESLRGKGELEGLIEGRRQASHNTFYALAASVLVALGFVSWYVVRQGTRVSPVLAASLDVFQGAATAASLDEIMLIRARSGQPVQVEIPPVPRLLHLKVLAPGDSHGQPANVQLLRRVEGNEPRVVQKLEDLKPDADGMFSVYLDPRAAGPGEFLLRLEGRFIDGAKRETQEHEFELK